MCWPPVKAIPPSLVQPADRWPFSRWKPPLGPEESLTAVPLHGLAGWLKGQVLYPSRGKLPVPQAQRVLGEAPSASTLATYLVRFVEEEAEVREDHPQLLPPVAVFEFPQQVPRQLILQDREAWKEYRWGRPCFGFPGWAMTLKTAFLPDRGRNPWESEYMNLF